jgi:hypothetical protein
MAALCSLLVATTAMAQSPKTKPRTEQGQPEVGRGKDSARPYGLNGVAGRGVVTPVMLIKSVAVQEELKLTGGQKKKLLEVNDEFNRKRIESANALSKAPDELNQGVLMEMIATLRSENEAAITRVLEPRQRTRLAQIALQLEGPLAVAEPEVAVKINLHPVQMESIQAILAEYKATEERLWGSLDQRIRAASDQGRVRSRGHTRRGSQGQLPGAQDGRDPGASASPDEFAAVTAELNRESAAIHEEAIRQVGKVLTRRQKDKFNRLLGEPLDIAMLRRGGGQGPKPQPPADAETILEPISPSDRERSSAKPRPEGLPRGSVAHHLAEG